MAKADLEKKPFDVAGMFDDVGAKYDTTNTVLSFGLDKYWRRRTRERLDLKPVSYTHLTLPTICSV